MPKRKPTELRDPSQQSLYAFFPQNDSSKRRKTLGNISNKLEEANKMPAATIIPPRDDGYGRGLFYDHYSMQLITNNPTFIASCKDEETVQRFVRHLNNYLKTNMTQNFKFGEPDEVSKRKLPQIAAELDPNVGLLVIPGVARNTEEKRTDEFEERMKFQKQLLKTALLVGQPILGICGGSWLLWEQFGGNVKKVKDHNCRSGMPQIKETTGKIGRNIQVHRITIEDNAFLLRAALNFTKNPPTTLLPVNSVHWKAADLSVIPSFYVVSALPQEDANIAPKNNKGEIMHPTSDSIEAFESKYGTPILGIQWHPEAYTNNSKEEWFPANQQHLLKFMVQAGQAFKLRRNLTEDFARRCQDEATFNTFKNTHLRKTGLIANTYTVVKTNKSSNSKYKLFTLKLIDQLRHKLEVEDEIEFKNMLLKQSKNKLKNSMARTGNSVLHSESEIKNQEIKDKVEIESTLLKQSSEDEPKKSTASCNRNASQSEFKVQIATLIASNPLWQKFALDSLRQTLHKANQIKGLLRKHIPEYYSLEAALGRGDCFFDAIARALSQMNNSMQEEHTAKSMRMFCDNYVKNPKNTWVEEGNKRDREDHNAYLTRIQFTASEMDENEKLGLNLGLPVWGRPKIEGRMICETWGVKLHVIEIQEDMQTIHRFLVDARGEREEVNPIVDYDDPSILHLVNYHNHYVPLLRNNNRLTMTSKI